MESCQTFFLLYKIYIGKPWSLPHAQPSDRPWSCVCGNDGRFVDIHGLGSARSKRRVKVSTFAPLSILVRLELALQ